MKEFIIALPFVLGTLYLGLTAASATTGPASTPFKVQDYQNQDEQDPPGEYFKANGTEPVWKLFIAEEGITFESELYAFKTFTMPHVEPVKVMDGIKKYTIQAETGSMEIEIAHLPCQKENSRERFNYGVQVSIRRTIDTTATLFSGCGLYIVDHRLEHRWLLQAIKGVSVDTFIYGDTLPFIDIKTPGNSFSGYGGCNNINGRIFSERNLLRFTDLVVGKRKCDATVKEQEFIQALQFSTQYKIEGDQLILGNPGKPLVMLTETD